MGNGDQCIASLAWKGVSCTYDHDGCWLAELATKGFQSELLLGVCLHQASQLTLHRFESGYKMVHKLYNRKTYSATSLRNTDSTVGNEWHKPYPRTMYDTESLRLHLFSKPPHHPQPDHTKSSLTLAVKRSPTFLVVRPQLQATVKLTEVECSEHGSFSFLSVIGSSGSLCNCQAES